MKGPSREAVLAHSFKVLHYREFFGTPGAPLPDNAYDSPAPTLDPVMDRYARDGLHRSGADRYLEIASLARSGPRSAQGLSNELWSSIQ